MTRFLRGLDEVIRLAEADVAADERRYKRHPVHDAIEYLRRLADELAALAVLDSRSYETARHEAIEYLQGMRAQTAACGGPKRAGAVRRSDRSSDGDCGVNERRKPSPDSSAPRRR